MDVVRTIVVQALSVLDALIYVDKKRVVRLGDTSLHPSETHMLTCAVEGLSFTEIAARFGVSKAAVSRAFARLSDKGLVRITKDPQANNRATVALTPAGQALFEIAEQVRRHLSDAFVQRLSGYSPDELQTVRRFLDDVEGFVHESFHSLPS